MLFKIVIVCNKRDFFLTRICVSSIRYFYPNIDIYIIKDFLNGRFDSTELEKVMNVQVLDLGIKKYGWAAAKMHLLLTNVFANEKVLLLDSDIVFAGRFLEMLNEQMKDVDFAVSADFHDNPSDGWVPENYYDINFIHSFDPDFRFPGYFFNSGQMVISTGKFSQKELGNFFDINEFPYYKMLDKLPLVDQSLLNYMMPKKEQNGEIKILKSSFMVPSHYKEAQETELKKVQDGNYYKYLIHWAGALRIPLLWKMNQADILAFFEAYYYHRVRLGRLKMSVRKIFPFFDYYGRLFYRGYIKRPYSLLMSNMKLHNSNDKRQVYMPQLDSLRAISLLLIVIFHWFSGIPFIDKILPNAMSAVILFFVLSGYLITGGLLKIKHNNRGKEKFKAYKVFYIRRLLRIFPLYYLLLVCLYFFGNKGFLQAPVWHSFYLSNIFFYLQNKFSDSVFHFWTLSVEEQFYLFWPLLVMWIPWKRLPLAFGAGIFIALIFRVCMTNPSESLARLLTPSCLDCFCLGGSFAYGELNRGRVFRFVTKHFKGFLLTSFSAVVIIEFLQKVHYSEIVFLSVYFTITSIFASLVVFRASSGFNQPLLKKILTSKPLLYIGKISYGIYLFHVIIPYFYTINLPFPFSYTLNIPKALGWPSLYVIELIRFLILIGLASASWFLFEKPINNLKRFFPYPKELEVEFSSTLKSRKEEISMPVIEIYK